LVGVGANQAIDQTHLYGRAVRWFAAPGVPDAPAAATWRPIAARAVNEACGAGGVPGPVHLNLAFREPLVGEPGPLPAARDGDRPWHTFERVRAVAVDVSDAVAAKRGIFVAGAGTADPDAVLASAHALRWPVLADHRSGCRVPGSGSVAAFDALVRAPRFADAHRPEVVVRAGAPLASRALNEWLACSGAHHLRVSPVGVWVDPEHVLSEVFPAIEVARPAPAPPEWFDGWIEGERRAQAAIEDVLRGHPEPTEPGVARAVMGALGEDDALVVGSSMPVRDVEWYAAARRGVRMYANRGASGIDGTVSTALGVAAAHHASLTIALLGDLAFLHDVGAIASAAGSGVDCTIVVLDNDGGGIFSFLPQADAVPRDRFELLFGTPHGLDLVAVARGFGVEARAVTELGEVVTSLRPGGVRVVVVRTSRAANVAVHREINEAVAAAM